MPGNGKKPSSLEGGGGGGGGGGILILRNARERQCLQKANKEPLRQLFLKPKPNSRIEFFNKLLKLRLWAIRGKIPAVQC